MNYLIKTSFLFAIIIQISCASSGAWRYKPISNKIQEKSISRSRVAVLPFEDHRKGENKNLSLISLIPLVPIGPINYCHIESGSMFLWHGSYQIRPKEDLAKAVIAELKTSNIFEEIFYTERENIQNVDLLIKGYIYDFSYKGGLITYGLMFDGPVFWLMGLPAGYSNNHLAIQIEIINKWNKKVLWKSAVYRDKRRIISGLYYNSGKEFDGYPIMMSEACKKWINEILDFIKKNPRALKKRY